MRTFALTALFCLLAATAVSAQICPNGQCPCPDGQSWVDGACRAP